MQSVVYEIIIMEVFSTIDCPKVPVKIVTDGHYFLHQDSGADICQHAAQHMHGTYARVGAQSALNTMCKLSCPQPITSIEQCVSKADIRA